MTDAQKINVIESIINKAYEFEPTDVKIRGPYYEGVIASISGVLISGGSEE